MKSFRLTADTMERLTAKFRAFQEDRETIRSLLGDYIADYRRFRGTELARQEHLREKYARRAPQLSHLVWDDQDGLFWGVTDISILLGRDRSSVSRTLVKMTEAEGWGARLVALRRVIGKNEAAPVYAYGEGIFELIIDYYEEDYLLRFTKPRRGKSPGTDEAEEIRSFWNYMKMAAKSDPNYFLRDRDIESSVMPDIPPMSLKEALRVIFGKMFSLRASALFNALFALCYQLSRRWPALYPWFPAAAVLTFLLCILLLRRGKFDHSSIAGLGAGSLIFCLFWLVGSLSHEGLISLPGGKTIQVRDVKREADLVLTPVIAKDGTIIFHISTNSQDYVKMFYYRISPHEEYLSAVEAFHTHRDVGLKYSETLIPTGQSQGLVQMDVKYTDIQDAEYGPYTFTVDLEKARLEAQKKLTLEHMKKWIIVERRPKFGDSEKKATYVEVPPSILLDRLFGVISGIAYGINRETPDTRISVKEARHMASDEIPLLESDDDSVEYVSAQLIFMDGTSSEIRVFKKSEQVLFPLN